MVLIPPECRASTRGPYPIKERRGGRDILYMEGENLFGLPAGGLYYMDLKTEVPPPGKGGSLVMGDETIDLAGVVISGCTRRLAFVSLQGMLLVLHGLSAGEPHVLAATRGALSTALETVDGLKEDVDLHTSMRGVPRIRDVVDRDDRDSYFMGVLYATIIAAFATVLPRFLLSHMERVKAGRTPIRLDEVGQERTTPVGLEEAGDVREAMLPWIYHDGREGGSYEEQDLSEHSSVFVASGFGGGTSPIEFEVERSMDDEFLVFRGVSSGGREVSSPSPRQAGLLGGKDLGLIADGKYEGYAQMVSSGLLPDAYVPGVYEPRLMAIGRAQGAAAGAVDFRGGLPTQEYEGWISALGATAATSRLAVAESSARPAEWAAATPPVTVRRPSSLPKSGYETGAKMIERANVRREALGLAERLVGGNPTRRNIYERVVSDRSDPRDTMRWKLEKPKGYSAFFSGIFSGDKEIVANSVDGVAIPSACSFLVLEHDGNPEVKDLDIKTGLGGGRIVGIISEGGAVVCAMVHPGGWHGGGRGGSLAPPTGGGRTRLRTERLITVPDGATIGRTLMSEEYDTVVWTTGGRQATASSPSYSVGNTISGGYRIEVDHDTEVLHCIRPNDGETPVCKARTRPSSGGHDRWYLNIPGGTALRLGSPGGEGSSSSIMIIYPSSEHTNILSNIINPIYARRNLTIEFTAPVEGYKPPGVTFLLRDERGALADVIDSHGKVRISGGTLLECSAARVLVRSPPSDASPYGSERLYSTGVIGEIDVVLADTVICRSVRQNGDRRGDGITPHLYTPVADVRDIGGELSRNRPQYSSRGITSNIIFSKIRVMGFHGCGTGGATGDFSSESDEYRFVINPQERGAPVPRGLKCIEGKGLRFQVVQDKCFDGGWVDPSVCPIDMRASPYVEKNTYSLVITGAKTGFRYKYLDGVDPAEVDVTGPGDQIGDGDYLIPIWSAAVRCHHLVTEAVSFCASLYTFARWFARWRSKSPRVENPQFRMDEYLNYGLNRLVTSIFTIWIIYNNDVSMQAHPPFDWVTMGILPFLSGGVTWFLSHKGEGLMYPGNREYRIGWYRHATSMLASAMYCVAGVVASTWFRATHILLTYVAPFLLSFLTGITGGVGETRISRMGRIALRQITAIAAYYSTLLIMDLPIFQDSLLDGLVHRHSYLPAAVGSIYALFSLAISRSFIDLGAEKSIGAVFALVFKAINLVVRILPLVGFILTESIRASNTQLGSYITAGSSALAALALPFLPVGAAWQSLITVIPPLADVIYRGYSAMSTTTVGVLGFLVDTYLPIYMPLIRDYKLMAFVLAPPLVSVIIDYLLELSVWKMLERKASNRLATPSVGSFKKEIFLRGPSYACLAFFPTLSAWAYGVGSSFDSTIF